MVRETCCLIEGNKKCSNSAGVGIFTKRFKKLIIEKNLDIKVCDSTGHMQLCDHHKSHLSALWAARSRPTKQKHSNGFVDDFKIDFNLFHVSSLKKYKRFYKLTTRGNLNNKAELIKTCSAHFYSQPVNEASVITNFLRAIAKEPNLEEKNSKRANGFFGENIGGRYKARREMGTDYLMTRKSSHARHFSRAGLALDNCIRKSFYGNCCPISGSTSTQSSSGLSNSHENSNADDTKSELIMEKQNN